MKRIIVFTVIVLVTACMLPSITTNAQEKGGHDNQNGFWVVVTNKHVKREATIQFYNDKKQLVYEEKITGRKLKLGKKKTIHCLEEGLNKALAAYNNDKTVLKNGTWIAALLASR